MTMNSIANKELEKVAIAGDAEAQFNLGVCYASGDGVTVDYAVAVKWFRKAADQGAASAQYNLGLCYAQGQGVSQDYAEAVKWVRKAAEQGHAQAQFGLGVSYGFGTGVEKNAGEAVIYDDPQGVAKVSPEDILKGTFSFEVDGIKMTDTPQASYSRIHSLHLHTDRKRYLHERVAIFPRRLRGHRNLPICGCGGSGLTGCGTPFGNSAFRVFCSAFKKDGSFKGIHSSFLISPSPSARYCRNCRWLRQRRQ